MEEIIRVRKELKRVTRKILELGSMKYQLQVERAGLQQRLLDIQEKTILKRKRIDGIIRKMSQLSSEELVKELARAKVSVKEITAEINKRAKKDKERGHLE